MCDSHSITFTLILGKSNKLSPGAPLSGLHWWHVTGPGAVVHHVDLRRRTGSSGSSRASFCCYSPGCHRGARRCTPFVQTSTMNRSTLATLIQSHLLSSFGTTTEFSAGHGCDRRAGCCSHGHRDLFPRLEAQVAQFQSVLCSGDSTRVDHVRISRLRSISRSMSPLISSSRP